VNGNFRLLRHQGMWWSNYLSDVSWLSGCRLFCCWLLWRETFLAESWALGVSRSLSEVLPYSSVSTAAASEVRFLQRGPFRRKF
jgi:hypothetical protein